MVINEWRYKKKKTALNKYLNKNGIEKLSMVNDDLKYNVFWLYLKILHKKKV